MTDRSPNSSGFGGYGSNSAIKYFSPPVSFNLIRRLMMSNHLAVCSLLVGLSSISIFGCVDNTKSEKRAKPKNELPTVLTVNYPIQYFAERIAGSLIAKKLNIELPVDRGIDPAFWRPSSAAISAFQKADLILLNGATYAKWTEIASLPEEKMIDTSSSFKDNFIKIEEAFVHQHGPEGEHNHAGIAFTTWLDFQQAKKQASSVRDALINLVPGEKESLQANFELLAADLDLLDRQMLSVCEKYESQPIVLSHPIYQYFSRRYQLNTKSVQWEPDIKIVESDLNDLKQILDTHPAKVMIWESDPGEENRKRLSDKFGLRCIVVSPCSNVGEQDWLSVMKQNIQNLKF